MNDNDYLMADLHVLASVCVRQGMDMRNLCVLSLLYRCGWLYASQVGKASGMSKSTVYNRLMYLESKGLVKRKREGRSVGWDINLWGLTDEGMGAMREYEACYRIIHTQMLRRQEMRKETW